MSNILKKLWSKIKWLFEDDRTAIEKAQDDFDKKLMHYLERRGKL
jgi:hypothetical protein